MNGTAASATTLAMRPLPILFGVLLSTAVPAFAQVTVDLRALDALPDHPASNTATARPSRMAPVSAAPVTAASGREASADQAAATTGRERRGEDGMSTAQQTGVGQQTAATRAVMPGQSVPPSAVQTAPQAAPQPAMPESVPQTATIEPITPPNPSAGAQAPPPPPISDKAATAAAPTSVGLRLTFAPGAADLNPESSDLIKQLAAAAPQGENTTFNVLAYAPGKPDDPSTARRVSLSRAMAVRSALVADGVPSARIFVRALGEQYGDGPPDRVDLNVAGATATGEPGNSAATAR